MGTGDQVPRPRLLAVLLVAVVLLRSAQAGYKPKCVEHGSYIRHPTRCNVFFQCSHGKPYKFKCDPGLVFSKKILNCVFPFQVSDECATAATKPQPPLSKKEVENSCSENAMAIFADPSSCQVYYNCSNNVITGVLQKYMVECPYPCWFDGVKLKCAHYSKVDCGLRKKVFDKCDWLTIGKSGDDCSGDDCLEKCKNKYPSCSGLPDGYNVNPLKKWTADFMECKDERLKRLRTCPFDDFTETEQVFDPERKGCVNLYEVPKEAGGHPFSCKRTDGCYPDDEQKNKRLYFCCVGTMLDEIGRCEEDEFFSRINRKCLKDGTDETKEALKD